MPIYDYKHKSELSLMNIKRRINKKNYSHLDKFLDSYDVSAARLNIFLKHIVFLLEKTKDIEQDMHDRDKINKIFKGFRSNLSVSYYSTIVNVSVRFVKWLNDGEKPKGFRDIKNNGKGKQRDLEADDMLTLDDGLNMLKYANTTQLKAVIMTQLDGGFRPSEFIDLKYGDISYEKPFFIAKIRQGKTGKRDVPLYKSVPYLKNWINEHPTKEKNDPLWIMEYMQYSSKKRKEKGIVKYNYAALLKRIKAISKAAGIKKPIDFYNFRHSACTISKLENTPVDIAANKFGHSVKYYTETYGRLDLKGMLERHKKHIGIQKEIKKENNLNVVCNICGYDNPPKTDICKKCFNPLTIQKAIEIKSKKDQEIKSLKSEVNSIKEMLKEMAKKGAFDNL